MIVENEPRSVPTISGRLVVFLMFVFAVIATVLLSFYWNRHLEPFMPLQSALVQEYGKDSKPRVDGGQRKMSKGTPKILRVVMGVTFDPQSAESDEQARARIREIARIAEKHAPLDEYDILTVHFYQENPGGQLRQKTFETPLVELRGTQSGATADSL